MNKQKNIERLGIFFVYQKIDVNVIYYLEKLSEVTQDIWVISKDIQGKNALHNVKAHVLFLPNDSDDSCIYAFAKNTVNKFKEISEKDEIIYLSDRNYGPFFDLSDYFGYIPQDADVWNFTDNRKIFIDNFFVVRNRLLHSRGFKEFWETLLDNNYINEDNINGFFDEVFLDFKKFALIDIKSLYGKNENKDYYIYDMVTKEHYPFIPKELFEKKKIDYLEYNNADEVTKLFAYLNQNKLFNTDNILKDLISKYNISDLKELFNWTYVLDSKINTAILKKLEDGLKVAVIAHLYYEEMFVYCLDYLRRVPDNIDIIISTNSSDKKESIMLLAKERNMELKAVVVSNNRGRELAALLVDIKEYLTAYKYFCFIHDKKSSGKEHLSVGLSFRDVLWDSCLFSEEYIENILNIFEENNCLGLAVPPTVYCGSYYYPFPDYWVGNYAKTKDFLNMLGVNINITEEKPIPCTGSVFWCRTSALKSLLDFGFTHNFFPMEPMGPNLTISHAIERSFPYVASYEGYYTATIMPTELAGVEVENLRSMLSKSTKVLRNRLYQNGKSFHEMVEIFDNDKLFAVGTGLRFVLYSISEHLYMKYIEDNIRILKENGCIVYLLVSNGITNEAREAYSFYTKNIIVKKTGNSHTDNWKEGIIHLRKTIGGRVDTLILLSEQIISVNLQELLSNNEDIAFYSNKDQIEMVVYNNIFLNDMCMAYWDSAKKSNDDFIDYNEQYGYRVVCKDNISKNMYIKNLVNYDEFVPRKKIMLEMPKAYEWMLENCNNENLARKFGLNYWVDASEDIVGCYVKIYVFGIIHNESYIKKLFAELETSQFIEIEYIYAINSDDENEIYSWKQGKSLLEILYNEKDDDTYKYVGIFNFSECNDEEEILNLFKETVKNEGFISKCIRTIDDKPYIGMIGTLWENPNNQINNNIALLSEYKSEITEFEDRLQFRFSSDSMHPLLNYNGFWLKHEALSIFVDVDIYNLEISANKLFKTEWIILPEVIRKRGLLLGTMHCMEDVKSLFVNNIYTINKFISSKKNISSETYSNIDEFIANYGQRIVHQIETEYEYVDVPIGVKGAIKNFIHNRLGVGSNE